MPKFETYPALVAWLCCRSEDAGRVATHTNLPPGRNADGVCVPHHDQGVWRLQNRFAGEAVALPQVVQVDQNWPVNRAAIRDSASSNVVEPCKSFFKRSNGGIGACALGASVVARGRFPWIGLRIGRCWLAWSRAPQE